MIIHFTIGAISGRQGIRTLIPLRGNRLSRAARQTVSDYLPFEWTAGESNPDFRCAKPVSSRWTSSPMIENELESASTFTEGPPENRTRVPLPTKEACCRNTCRPAG